MSGLFGWIDCAEAEVWPRQGWGAVPGEVMATMGEEEERIGQTEKHGSGDHSGVFHQIRVWVEAATDPFLQPASFLGFNAGTL